MSRSKNKSKKKRLNSNSRKVLLLATMFLVIALAVVFLIFGLINADNKGTDIKNNGNNSNIVTDNKVGVTGLVVDKSSVSVVVGSSVQLKVTVEPSNAADATVTYTSDNESIARVDGSGMVVGVKAGSCNVRVVSNSADSVFRDVKVVVKAKVVGGSDNVSNSGGLTYIKGILVVNKSYSLPSTYNPGTDSKALAAFNSMKAAAAKDGIGLFVVSGFRSYSYQSGLYNRYVARSGRVEADRYSARPGHSEHQTGLAFDVNNADSSFAGSKEAVWLAKNSYRFGFIIRYPAGKESITGYMYEPWHIRFLGVEKATEVFESKLTLEEFLGIDSRYK